MPKVTRTDLIVHEGEIMQMVTDKKTFRAIAAHFRCSRGTIRRIAARHGVVRTKPTGAGGAVRRIEKVAKPPRFPVRYVEPKLKALMQARR